MDNLPKWIVLCIVGAIIYGVTYAPVFPPPWASFARWLGGFLILVGIIWFLLILFNVGVPG